MAERAWVERDRLESDSSDTRGVTAGSVSRSLEPPRRAVLFRLCRGEFSEFRRFRKLI